MDSTTYENDLVLGSYISSLVIADADEDIWLGGSDRDVEGEWRWVSNDERIEFTAWETDEPNNSLGAENCIGFYTQFGDWNDIPCDVLKRAICEEM